MEKKCLFCASYTAHEIWNVSSSPVRKNSFGEGSPQNSKAPLVRRGLNNCQSVRYLRNKLIIAPVLQDNDCY
jgi:hypothetical protein